MSAADPPAPLAAAPSAAPSRAPLVVFCLFIASTMLCLLAYVAMNVPANWFSSALPIRWTARDLATMRGTAKLERDALTVLAPDATGMVLLSVNTTFRSVDYPVIAWDAAGVSSDIDATLLWRNDYISGRIFSRPLSIDDGHIAPAAVAGDPNWIGTISGLALLLRGRFAQPMFLRGATAKPMTAAEVLGDRFDEWFAFEGWNAASIDRVIGGADAQALPLPAFLAAAFALAALAYAALARWIPGRIGRFRPVVVGGLFLACWFALDARWQWNLTRQVGATWGQYAGKPSRERHLAAEDGALFAFIETVRSKLPPPPARVFIAADSNYIRGRAAYHLYPYNVYYDPARNTIPPASAMRPGDYLVVFDRAGVQFNSAQQRLRWDNGEPVAAELVVIAGGAALFRIL